MASLVVDSQPLLALMADEPDAARIRARLEQARDAGEELVISAVNWCEVLYVCRRLLGEPAAVRAIDAMHRLPLSVVPADDVLATYAADLKARFHLGLGDAFAAGLAIATGSPLLTGDRDLRPLAEHGLLLQWIDQ